MSNRFKGLRVPDKYDPKMLSAAVKELLQPYRFVVSP